MVKLLEEFGVGSSIIAVGFLEAIAVSWFYGIPRSTPFTTALSFEEQALPTLRLIYFLPLIRYQQVQQRRSGHAWQSPGIVLEGVLGGYQSSILGGKTHLTLVSKRRISLQKQNYIEYHQCDTHLYTITFVLYYSSIFWGCSEYVSHFVLMPWCRLTMYSSYF